jgi:hypothetical protein
MRERVANKTDFDPTETRYRDQITELLNEAYRHVWNETVWPFSQKLVYFDLYPDLTSSRLGGVTVTTKDGERLVSFSAPVYELDSQRSVLVGNIIELHGRDYEILEVRADPSSCRRLASGFAGDDRRVRRLENQTPILQPPG